MDLPADDPTASAAPGPVGAGHPDRIWKVVVAVAALALVGFIAFVATRPHHARVAAFPSARPTTLPIGSTAPDFALPRLGGGPVVSLSALRGTPAVVNFFASWCPDCQAELAAFAALATRTSGRVTVIGVDSNDGSGAAAQTLLSEARASYPVGMDSDAKVATTYLLSALPVTYFLDGRGRVVHVATGTQTEASLQRWTDALNSTTGSADGATAS